MTSIKPEYLLPKVPIVLDCDPGIDDAMALLYGLRAPEVDIVAVTTVWGNVGVDLATVNAIRLLEIGGRPDIPVSKGADRPLIGDTPTFAEWVHGPTGTGHVSYPDPAGVHTAEPAAMTLVRLAHERPHELTLCAIGPLTNLGAALSIDPDIATLYKDVVIMGGACLIPGNVSRYGEANIWHDPEAAQAVFQAPWPIVLVPLDVTERALVSELLFEQLRDTDTPVGRHLHEISDVYFNAYARRGLQRESPMHDALALGIAVDRSLITEAPLTRVDVELNGTHTRGMTVADLRKGVDHSADANVQVVLRADSPKYIRRWFDVLASWS